MENKSINGLYLIDTTEAVSYIVDQPFLEIMVTTLLSPEDLVCLKYGTRLEWHIGEDKRVYETLGLTKEGEKHHEMIDAETHAKQSFEALNEMGKNINSQNLSGEKNRLSEFLRINEISQISNYEGKEFETAKKTVANHTF